MSQENLSLGFPTRSDTNRFVPPQKMARGSKFEIFSKLFDLLLYAEVMSRQLVLVLFLLNVPVNNFSFRHVGTEPPLPGYYQYFREINVSCSRTQHCDLSEESNPPTSHSGV